ncbi:MAG: alpha/beta hydrolase [Bacteroidota bacterium]
MSVNNTFRFLIILLPFSFFVGCKQKPGAKQQTEVTKETSQRGPQNLISTTETFFHGFRDVDMTIDGVNIHAVVGGSGEPLLLLHGAPESHVMWRDLAPELAKSFTVVVPDLRGYGRSDKPREGDYSKRRMAKDQIALMNELGYDSFLVASHDRGSHAARRLAKDHPKAVKKMVIMDVVPATYVWEHIDGKVADRFWAWIFWTQPYPLPENLMGPQAGAFAKMAAGDDVEAGEDYAKTNGTQDAFHAMCEDYRASKSVDMEHDKADAHIKIDVPTLVIWGSQSNTGNFDYPTIWENEVNEVSFLKLDAGHFIVEEKPMEVLEATLSFFRPLNNK